MPADTPESRAKITFQKHLTKLPQLKMFTNLRGLFWTGRPDSVRNGTVILKFARQLKAGWGPDGTSDFIGYETVTVTPAMVGQKIARFTAAELKRFDGKNVRTTVDQIDFIDMVNRDGGKAHLIDSEQRMLEAFPHDVT